MCRANENHRTDAFGIRCGHVQQRHATRADARRPDLFDLEVIEQGKHVLGRLPVGERLCRVGRTAMPSQVIWLLPSVFALNVTTKYGSWAPLLQLL